MWLKKLNLVPFVAVPYNPYNPKSIFNHEWTRIHTNR